MSQVLSSVVAGTATKTSLYEKANPAISPSTSQSQQSMTLFSGAVIQGGNFSININTVNQSPKLTLEETNTPEVLQSWKKLRPLEDSDNESKHCYDMNMLLYMYITSFKISSFPLAEILNSK